MNKNDIFSYLCYSIQQPNQQFETITLPDAFFNPVVLRQPPFYDQMMQTLYTQPMQSVDESFTKGLSRFLFKGDAPFGLDLAAININRGKDWALRSYNDYLSVIGFKKVTDFSLYGPEVSCDLRFFTHQHFNIMLFLRLDLI